EEHWAVNQAEYDLTQAGRPPAEPKELRSDSSWQWQEWGRLALRITLSISLWAYFIQAFFRAYGYEFFATWCQAYLEKAFGLSKSAAGQLTTWPLFAFGTGSILGGVLVDFLLVRWRSRWVSRSGTAIAGLSLCAACFALATLINHPVLLIIILSLGCLFAAMAGPATWSAGMDLGGRWTPVIFGIMNMTGNIGAYLCPIQVGELFDHIEATEASWMLVLWLFVG